MSDDGSGLGGELRHGGEVLGCRAVSGVRDVRKMDAECLLTLLSAFDDCGVRGGQQTSRCDGSLLELHLA